MINYVVVNWNSERLEYEVIYHDQNALRSEHHFERLRKQYPNCQIMVNAFQIKKEDAKKQLLETVERMQSEALRRKKDISRKSSGITNPT